MVGERTLGRAIRVRDMIFQGDRRVMLPSPDLAVFRRDCGAAVRLTAEADPRLNGGEDDLAALLAWAAVARCSPEPDRRPFLEWVDRHRRDIRALGRLAGDRTYPVEEVLERKNFACWWAVLWGDRSLLPRAADGAGAGVLLCARYAELGLGRGLPFKVAPLNFLAEAGIAAAGMRLSGDYGLAGRVRSHLVMASRSASLCGWRMGSELARWLLAAVWVEAVCGEPAGRGRSRRMTLQ